MTRNAPVGHIGAGNELIHCFVNGPGSAPIDHQRAPFHGFLKEKGYGNRSEAIRDLVRDHFVEEDIASNKVVVATLTLVYDHHQPNLAEQLIEAQHAYKGQVLATTHVHLDHRNCLEVIILKGRGRDAKKFSDHLLSLKGVKHGKLVLTNAVTSLPCFTP